MNNRSENAQSSSQKMSTENISEILDKMLKLQEKEKKPSFFKKTICIVASICVVIFVIFICIIIYKNNFTTESILSTLLAFFSIFISVFFYFKADETSSKFYDSSYKFMKDISVTLGKIEERFGEKLNSLSDKVSHLDRESKAATEEIEDKQEDKDRIINELMEKANLSEAERSEYKKMLESKDQEIEQLQMYRMRAEREASRLRHKMDQLSSPARYATPEDNFADTIIQTGISPQMLKYILENRRLPEDISPRTRKVLRANEVINPDGDINIENLVRFMERLEQRYY